MHVVIMGCGRVGSTLARTLEGLGHTVAVIDRTEAAFKRLPASFQGKTVTGFGFDRDTLEEAGIAEAGAFAAVSNGDNSNIISARVARENFGVEHVVARIYDPKRAEVYERLGIPTVATVRWTADQVLRRLIPAGSQLQWSDPSGEVLLAEVAVNRAWAGHRIAELETSVEARVACMTRLGVGRLPEKGDVVQEGDLFHFMVVKDRLSEVERIIAGGPEGTSH
ncbi:MAG TPA: TrkA family potassium uptake protein [Mycobacteriales bacterium]|nr:TrkA family potassium uptake protein [Mycobacteriales bacterium]